MEQRNIDGYVPAQDIAYLPSSINYIFSHCHPSSVQVEPVYRFGRGKDAETAEKPRCKDQRGDRRTKTSRTEAVLRICCRMEWPQARPNGGVRINST
jgi:hypothetical protein